MEQINLYRDLKMTKLLISNELVPSVFFGQKFNP